MPVGIAEMGLPGVRFTPESAKARIPAVCTAKLVRIDNRPVWLRISGTVGAAEKLQGLTVSGCGPDAKGIDLGPGNHTVDARWGKITGWDLDRLVLDSAPGGAALPPLTGGGVAPAPGTSGASAASSLPAPVVRVLSSSATSAELQVKGAHAALLARARRKLERRLGGHRAGRAFPRGASAHRRLRERLVRLTTARQHLCRDAPVRSAEDRDPGHPRLRCHLVALFVAGLGPPRASPPPAFTPRISLVRESGHWARGRHGRRESHPAWSPTDEHVAQRRCRSSARFRDAVGDRWAATRSSHLRPCRRRVRCRGDVGPAAAMGTVHRRCHRRRLLRSPAPPPRAVRSSVFRPSDASAPPLR